MDAPNTDNTNNSNIIYCHSCNQYRYFKPLSRFAIECRACGSIREAQLHLNEDSDYHETNEDNDDDDFIDIIEETDEDGNIISTHEL